VSRLSHCVVMLDRRETKEDHLGPCIAQVAAIREVADASPLPRRGPTLPLFACVLRAQSTNASLTGRVTDLSRATVAEAKVAAMNTGTNFHCVALVQYATAQRPANTELFKQWIEQWKPLAYRGMEGVVELFGQAPRPVEPKAVSAKVRAAHHAFLARCGLNAVQVDS